MPFSLWHHHHLDAAGLFPGPEQNELFFVRFNGDRSMPVWVDRERTLEIRRRYYNNDLSAGLLPPDHPPIIFAKFRDDFPNLLATRERYPPLRVAFLATLDGETSPLALPLPRTAFLPASEVSLEAPAAD